MKVGWAEAGVEVIARKSIKKSDYSTRTVDQPVFAAPYTVLDTGPQSRVGRLIDDGDSTVIMGPREEKDEADNKETIDNR